MGDGAACAAGAASPVAVDTLSAPGAGCRVGGARGAAGGVMADGWDQLPGFRCACGAWCAEWRNYESHRWRVRHGEGEALFAISLATVVDELALPVEESSYQCWLARVHAYERQVVEPSKHTSGALAGQTTRGGGR